MELRQHARTAVIVLMFTFIYLVRLLFLGKSGQLCTYSHGDTDIILVVNCLRLSCAAPVLCCHNCSVYGLLMCVATKSSLGTSVRHVKGMQQSYCKYMVLYDSFHCQEVVSLTVFKLCLKNCRFLWRLLHFFLLHSDYFIEKN